MTRCPIINWRSVYRSPRASRNGRRDCTTSQRAPGTSSGIGPPDPAPGGGRGRVWPPATGTQVGGPRHLFFSSRFHSSLGRDGCRFEVGFWDSCRFPLPYSRQRCHECPISVPHLTVFEWFPESYPHRLSLHPLVRPEVVLRSELEGPRDTESEFVNYGKNDQKPLFLLRDSEPPCCTLTLTESSLAVGRNLSVIINDVNNRLFVQSHSYPWRWTYSNDKELPLGPSPGWGFQSVIPREKNGNFITEYEYGNPGLWKISKTSAGVVFPTPLMSFYTKSVLSRCWKTFVSRLI